MPVLLASEYHDVGNGGSVSLGRESSAWEKFDESWQYGFSDVMVSVPQPFVADRHRVGISRVVTPAEIYLERNGWIELHFSLVGDRNADYVVIVNRLYLHDGGCKGPGESVENNLASICGESPMLVGVAHSVQPPQLIGFKAIPSVIRLKRFDRINGGPWNSSGLPPEPLSAVTIEALNDWKIGVVRVHDASRSNGETPNQIIQRRTHGIDGISGNERDWIGNISQSHLHTVASSFRIVITVKGIRFSIGKNCNFNIQEFKVMLRPSKFQIGVSYSDHEAS
jgi:hypothetical protein